MMINYKAMSLKAALGATATMVTKEAHTAVTKLFASMGELAQAFGVAGQVGEETFIIDGTSVENRSAAMSGELV